MPLLVGTEAHRPAVCQKPRINSLLTELIVLRRKSSNRERRKHTLLAMLANSIQALETRTGRPIASRR